jgi:hypothetical protein
MAPNSGHSPLEKVKSINSAKGKHPKDQVKSKSDKKHASKEQENKKEDEDLELSFANVEGRCHVCGVKGHFADKCSKRNSTPKDEWFWENVKKKEISLLNSTQRTYSAVASTPVHEGSSDTPTGKWSMLSSHATDISLLQGGLELSDVILLDSQSTTNMFCNPKFVEDIRPAETPLLLNTNGGGLITTFKATLPDFGEVWFNEDAIANLFCMADIDDKYGMEWSMVDGKKAIRVMTDPPVDFVRSPEKLYYLLPRGLGQAKNFPTVHLWMPLRKIVYRIRAVNLNGPSVRDSSTIPSDLHQSKISRALSG